MVWLSLAQERFLRAAFGQHRLAQALFDELASFGQVPKRYLPEGKTYLVGQEWAFRECAERILKDPDNLTLREQLSQPSLPPSV